MTSSTMMSIFNPIAPRHSVWVLQGAF